MKGRHIPVVGIKLKMFFFYPNGSEYPLFLMRANAGDIFWKSQVLGEWTIVGDSQSMTPDLKSMFIICEIRIYLQKS